MVTQLVAAVFGGLLVVVALVGWREGTLLGSRRGQWRFVATVFFLAAAGLGLAAVAASISLREPATRVLTGDGYQLALPDHWVRDSDLEAQLPGGARLYGDGRHELMVVTTEPRPANTAGTVREALAAAAGEEPAGEGTTVQERARWLRVDRRYDSPRGPVIARTLAYVDPSHQVGFATATCTHDGDPEVCEGVLSTFELRLPSLPLEAPLAP